MKKIAALVAVCFTLQGCATAIAIVDVTASTVIYTSKTVVGLVTPDFSSSSKPKAK